MELSVIASNQFDEVPCTIRSSERMATDATGIDQVRLLQSVQNARVLGEVAIGQMHLGEEGFRLLVDAPADDPHLCRVFQASTLARNRVLLVGTVDEIVTRFAECNQIIRAVPADLT